MFDSVGIINIERAVISSMLFDYELIDSVIEKLTPEMLYLPAHQKVYKVILELYKDNSPVDEEFVRVKIDPKEVDDSVLFEIMASNPISNTLAYCEEIIEHYTQRELIRLPVLIKKMMIEENKSSSETMDEVYRRLSSIENLDTASNDIKLISEWDEQFQKEPELAVIPTKIQWSDSAVDGGIKLGNFVYLSGKKETGKTYLATTILENIAEQGYLSGFFSMEFGTKHYLETLKEKYPHKDNQKRIFIFNHIYVEHRVNEISDIEKKVKRMVKKGVKFIFIDSQLRVTNGSKTNATKAEILADSFSRIGLMAQKYEIVVMMVVQTSKSDHDANEISVKGCIDADHEASLWIHIKKQKEGELRDMIFAKNKQNFKRPKVTVKFNPHTHEFKKVNFETKEGIPVFDEREEPIVTEYDTDSKVDARLFSEAELPSVL